jgi:hypothetical protein
MNIIKKQLFFTFCFLFSVVQAQYTSVKGHIVDTKNMAVIFTPMVNSKLMDLKRESSTKEGNYELKLSNEKPSIWKMSYKDRFVYLFLIPNTLLEINLDYIASADFEFNGKNATDQLFLNDPNKLSFYSSEISTKLKEIAKQNDPFLYKKEVMAEANKLKTAFQNHALYPQISSDLKNFYSKNNIELIAYQYFFSYPKFLGVSQDSFYESDLDYYQFKNELLYQNYRDFPLYIDMHYQFLRLEIALEISKDYPNKIGEDLFFYKKLIELSKRYSEISVRRALEERALGDWIGYYGKPLELKDEITSFLSKEFDVKKSQAIKKKLLSLAEYEKSRSAPIFNYIDENNKNHNSKELIGKLVYIYVWNSKYPTSIENMILCQEISNEFKGNDKIVFLYMSIDNEIENWKQKIGELGIQNGLHGIAYPYEFQSDFAKKYNIQTLPHFLLIDKSGNLVALRAPKPSQKEHLISILKAHLLTK